MILSLIVAMDRNGVIGEKGKLPWHIPADLERFKKMTVGKAIVMGKNTFISIGRPLPNRVNIVLTSDMSLDTGSAQKALSVEEAKIIAFSSGVNELVFIGGRKVYQTVLPIVQKMYVTDVIHSFNGDVFFPCDEINWNDWVQISEEIIPKGEKTNFNLRFLVYERRKG